MIFQQVLRVRRPRRLLLGILLTIVLLVLIARRQLSPQSRRATKFLSHSSDDSNVEQVDWRQSLNERRRHRGKQSIDDAKKRSRDVEEKHRRHLRPVGDVESVVADSAKDVAPTQLNWNQQQQYEIHAKSIEEQNGEKEDVVDNNKVEEEPIERAGDVEPMPYIAAEIRRRNPQRGIEPADITEEHKDDVDGGEGDLPTPLLTSGKATSGSFLGDLERVVDFNKNVVLSVVDSGYVSMAINFFRTSVKPLGLKNFLMVCTDKAAVKGLRRQGIACSPYQVPEITKPKLLQRDVIHHGGGAKSASDFGTADYYHKSNAKTSVVLAALEHGYNVLIVDVDVIMFKNPFPFFNCTTCDAHFQMDREMYNSGFAFIRPTAGSQKLYQKTWSLYTKYQKAHDQVYLNMAINRLNPNDVIIGYSRRVANLNAVRLQPLPVSLFPCGVYYFEHSNRMFNNTPVCEDCVMAHNNYIGSVAAKVYRFKENLLWTINDNEYYSNKSARYFTYENPFDFESNTVDMELDALKSALAISMATGRLLILPTFRCCARNCRAASTVSTSLRRVVLVPSNSSSQQSLGGGSALECSHPRHRCSLLSLLKVSRFDRVFRNRYREHSFLGNPLVHDDVRRAAFSSPTLFINVSGAVVSSPSAGHVVVTPSNREGGATLAEVVRWVSERKDAIVVRFHSLYGATIDWKSDKAFGARMERYFQAGFECSEYEQWDSHLLDLVNLWPENRVH